jgi:Restriction endonuclease
VNVDGIRSFMAVLGGNDIGLFVNTGGFTSEAQREARNQETRRITLFDARQLFDLWVTHYPNFPSRHASGGSRRNIGVNPIDTPDGISRPTRRDVAAAGLGVLHERSVDNSVRADVEDTIERGFRARAHRLDRPCDHPLRDHHVDMTQRHDSHVECPKRPSSRRVAVVSAARAAGVEDPAVAPSEPGSVRRRRTPDHPRERDPLLFRVHGAIVGR